MRRIGGGWRRGRRRRGLVSLLLLLLFDLALRRLRRVGGWRRRRRRRGLGSQLLLLDLVGGGGLLLPRGCRLWQSLWWWQRGCKARALGCCLCLTLFLLLLLMYEVLHGRVPGQRHGRERIRGMGRGGLLLHPRP